MADFKYKALDKSANPQQGTIAACDRRTAALMLQNTGLSVISLKPIAEGDASSPSAAECGGESFGGGEKTALKLFRKLRQLCSNAAMPVSDALKTLSLRSNDISIKKLSRLLYKDLSEGSTLSNALKKYPDTFDNSMTHLVEAGETTANLGFVFANIIEYIEARRALRRNIVGALAYPVFLCALASGVVALFLFFMLPKIKTMMANMGAEENAPIKLMNIIGDVLTTGIPALACLVLASAVTLKIYRRSERGKLASDGAFLKLPVVGSILLDVDVCSLSALSSTLFASGVNTTETFRLAEKSIKNEHLKRRFNEFRSAVNDGSPISQAMQRFGILDGEDIDIIGVGERTGSLVDAFAEINKSHTESMNSRIKTATTVLGGIALGTAFTLVFVFAMGIVLSILGLSQSIIAK